MFHYNGNISHFMSLLTFNDNRKMRIMYFKQNLYKQSCFHNKAGSSNTLSLRNYLAPNFVWERGIVLLVWVCESVVLFVVLFVVLWFCDQDNSKSSWPILMKFGTMLSYNKNKVWLEFDKNGFGRTRTLSNRNFKISITQKVMGEFLLTFTEWCVESIII